MDVIYEQSLNNPIPFNSSFFNSYLSPKDEKKFLILSTTEKSTFKLSKIPLSSVQAQINIILSLSEFDWI